jgi:endonuclease/exonuclease/phosphatase (EEP) superfamily protein YafD
LLLVFRRLLAVLVVVVLVAALAVVAWPEALGLQRRELVAQAVSFRGATAVVAVGIAVLLTALGFVLHRARVLLGVVALVLLVFAGAEAALLLQRGIGAPDMPEAGGDDVTVLSWNTLGDSVPASVIARVAREGSADVVSLPETTRAHADAVAGLLARSGRRFTVLSRDEQPGIRARSTSLLISRSLGRYRLDTSVGETHNVPSVVAVPSGGQNAPKIVAVHTKAPYGLDIGEWRSDVAWAAARCSGPNTLMAGDFNSTSDHFEGLGTSSSSQLGACRDGGLATRNGAVGTWPTSVPALVGTPIDHVLATANWRFTGFRVLSDEDAAGSDHRPVLARLTPAG